MRTFSAGPAPVPTLGRGRHADPTFSGHFSVCAPAGQAVFTYHLICRVARRSQIDKLPLSPGK